MRIHEIRLRHYRGIVACDVVLPVDGVTIVHGPNEVGKSSLAQAIDLLFDFKDSSKDRRVRAVIPVHRDASPEIAIRAEVGRYTFTYTKQFGRERRTELVVSAPSRQSETGDAAHDRVRQILATALDADLWKALRIEQGAGLAQADVAGVRGLAAALDRAAGSDRESETVETLMAAARDELALWFTPAKRRPTKTLTEQRKKLAELSQTCEALRADLEALEQKTERFARLEIERRSAEKAHAAAVVEARESGEARRRVEALEREAELARQRARAASGDARATAIDRETRAASVASARDGAAALAALDAAASQNASVSRAAVDALAVARKALGAAETADGERRVALDRARTERECLRASVELAVLVERRGVVAATLEEVQDAEGVLARTRVDEPRLKQIESAAREIELAQQLRAQAVPHIEIEAERDTEVEIDEERGTLSAGSSTERAIVRRAEVHVPGAVRVTVHAGVDAERHAADVGAAEARLAEQLAAVGCDSVDAATESAALRRRASLTLERGRELLAELVPDAEPETLEREIEATNRRLATLSRQRGSADELPGSEDAAVAQLEAALGVAETAESALGEARRAERNAAERVAREREAAREQATRLELARKTARETSAALAGARAAHSDDALATSAAELNALAEREQARAAKAAAELSSADPENVLVRAERAEKALRAEAARAESLRLEGSALREHLNVRGEAGLREKLDTTVAEHFHCAGESERCERRASAAAKLYDTLVGAREAAHSGYQAPLRDRIEQFGQRVFGGDFSVEVDEDLRVIRRTLNGVTLPFESLSTGAQEQISLIARLACAHVVEADGGVPLVLDDTLGHTDPDRLKAMAQLLGRAAAGSQVVVLTSNPDRYRDVPGAHWIELRADTVD